MKLPVSNHTTTIANDTDGQGSVNGRGNLLVNMLLELPRRREKPPQKPVCTLLQDILITRDHARMEVLPEDAPLASPCRTIRKEAESPLVSSAAIARISECLENRWSNAELTVQCSVSACGLSCSRSACQATRILPRGSPGRPYLGRTCVSGSYCLQYTCIISLAASVIATPGVDAYRTLC